jgi:hypothetical protein
MKPIFALVTATVYGLFVHALFGFFGNIMQVMSLSLIALAPMVIGYLTVALSKPEYVQGNTAAFFLPWLTCLALLIITIALSMEGAICWIMIFPFFAVAAGLGGIIAYQVRKRKRRQEQQTDEDILDDNMDDWRNPGTLSTSVLALLPLMFGYVESDRTMHSKSMVIREEMEINAPAARVWTALSRVPHIQKEDSEARLSNGLGMPRHLRTEVDTLCVGGHRTAVFEGGLVFEEVIVACEPERLLRVQIHVDPSKVPPTVLDEHIVIGGKHLDVQEDTYRITPLPGGGCRLEVEGRMSIATPFNWYAGIWADFLVSDILHATLTLVKKRAERSIGSD